MNLLAVIVGWLKPEPLPHWDIAEVVFGGPYDGDKFWVNSDWADGHEMVYEGLRYRLEWRSGKRVWRLLTRKRPCNDIS
jgi:hypothetical protein